MALSLSKIFLSSSLRWVGVTTFNLMNWSPRFEGMFKYGTPIPLILETVPVCVPGLIFKGFFPSTVSTSIESPRAACEKLISCSRYIYALVVTAILTGRCLNLDPGRNHSRLPLLSVTPLLRAHLGQGSLSPASPSALARRKQERYHNGTDCPDSRCGLPPRRAPDHVSPYALSSRSLRRTRTVP